jgi:signal transduction histidine kinase
MLRPICILYMEDDSGVARLFQKKLERLGYKVDLAANGSEGLAMYESGQYDLLAVDQKMPIFDGLQVIRSLAERNCLPPTIMITGAGDEDLAVEAMKLGAGDYIVKDVDGRYFELLPTVIEQLLNRQRLIQERQQALEAVEEHNRKLALLNHIGQTLIGTLNRDEIVQQLLTAAVNLIGAQGSSLWLYEGDQGLACKGISCADSYQVGLSERLYIGEGLAGQVIQFGIKLSSADPANLQTYPDTEIYAPAHVNALLAVPLRTRDTLIGVLEVASTNTVFCGDDESLLETLAASGAMALDNARLVETLHQNMIELQDQNEDLAAFSHTVAHDLKNPINLMMGFSNLLKTQSNVVVDDDSRMYLDFIEKSGYKLVNIVDELLLLAQIRKIDVQTKPLNMREILSDAYQRLTNVIGESGAEIVIAEDWPVALGYAAWIEEVWVNYLSNAIKYGGQPPRIEIGAALLPDNFASFWITDNGPGLTDDQQMQLFTPFTRFGQVRAEGHGLGLSIVRRIVEKLGGQVSVTSKPGLGSTFGFTLPLMVEHAYA